MWHQLSLHWKRFTPLEEQLFAGARTVLPGGLWPTFDAQVAAINRVQRLPPAWSEIDFYCLRQGKVDWSHVPSFPCTDEIRLAEARFNVRDVGYRATLSCMGGHSFAFTFVPGPKAIAFLPFDAPPHTRLLVDPRRLPTGRREPEPVPPTWLEFLARHPGGPPKGWALHDPTSAQRVALGDGEYLILAERAGEEFILHRLDPPDERLFHLRGTDGTPTPALQNLEEELGYEGR